MAFRNDDHRDEKLFKNRLWKLMQEKNIDTAHKLATELHHNKFIKIKHRKEWDFNGIDDAAIGSIVRIIQNHLNSDTPAKLQTEYAMAYCQYFGCSADYLYGFIPNKTHENTDINKETGLSDKTIDFIKAMSKEEIKTLEAYINTGSNITMLLMLEFWYQSFRENIMVYGNGTSQQISKEMKESMIEYAISKQSVNIFNNILHDESTRDFFDKFLENENPISEAVVKGFLCE